MCPDPAAPLLGRTCSVCAKPIAADAVRCDGCGTPVAESYRCPHCHAIADVRPSARLRYSCAICGRPRIPIEDPGVVCSQPGTEALVRAGNAGAAAGLWRVMSIVVCVFGVFALMIMTLALLLARPGIVPILLALAANAVPFVFAAFAARQAALQKARETIALETAWSAAAGDVARRLGGVIEAKQLARVTRISEPDADLVLTRLAASSAASSTVSDDGSLRYRLLEAHEPGSTETDPSQNG